MKKVIKIDGEIRIEEGQTLSDISSYAMNTHRFNIKGLPEYEYKGFDIESSKSKIDYMLAYYKKNADSTTKLFESIIKTDNFENILHDFVDEYVENYKSRKKVFDKKAFFIEQYALLNETLYFSISEIIKKIIGVYFKNVVKDMNQLQVSKCERVFKDEEKQVEFLDGLKIPFSKKAIESGIKDLSVKALAGEIHDKYQLNYNHICFNNCSVIMCPKVADMEKKQLDEYEFIKDGLQIYKENGELEKFLVYRCDQKAAMEQMGRLR